MITKCDRLKGLDCGFYTKNNNPKFTAKGRKVKIQLKNGKHVNGIVEQCTNGFADVKVGNKTILINSEYKEM